MTESPSYKMYAADTIKLVKATLQGTTEPLVPYKTDPLEFCHEAHKVKDKLVSNALELLENDMPMTKQGAYCISFNDSAPEPGQKVLVWTDGKTKGPFIIIYDQISHALKVAGEMVLMTHWMPLPEQPKENC